MKKLAYKNIGLQQGYIALATLSAVVLFGAGIAYLRRRSSKAAAKLNRRTMPGYVFTVKKGSKMVEAFVVRNGGYYNVYLWDKLAGKMWQDEQELRWHTDSNMLVPLASQLAAKLEKVFTRKGFASLLQGTYPEITSSRWSGEETLELQLAEQTEMEVFTTFFKDEVKNLVDFEEHLDILLKKKGQQYFTLVSIN